MCMVAFGLKYPLCGFLIGDGCGGIVYGITYEQMLIFKYYHMYMCVCIDGGFSRGLLWLLWGVF